MLDRYAGDALDLAPPLVVDAEIVDDPPTDPEPVELDPIVDAEVVEAGAWETWRSPLAAAPWEGDYPTMLRGGVVTDPAEVQRIGDRIAYARLPFWRRWITPKPAGWR